MSPNDLEHVLQQIPKTKSPNDVEILNEVKSGPTVLFARTADLRQTPDNFLIGYWEFTAPTACKSKRSSAVSMDRIKSYEDFVPCEDGTALVRIQLSPR